MDEKEIKQMRKKIFPLIKIAEDKLENASLILEREVNIDAIPILFKAVDIGSRALLAFKQKPSGDFKNNIKLLEEEYKREGLLDKETVESFQSLAEMNEKYSSEIELEYDETLIKGLFEKLENFLAQSKKFLKNQLITPKERMIKRRLKRAFIISAAAVGSLLVIFLLFKIGMSLFGPKQGLLAHYYNNVNLEGQPAVERIDKKIDFVWGGLPPHDEIKGEFSVRWEGRIRIARSDIYTFYIKSDEGIRFFIDDKLLIDTWSEEQRVMEHSASVKLRGGFHKIKLEFYFNQKFADIKLLWSSSSFDKRTVGNKVLFPPVK